MYAVGDLLTKLGHSCTRVSLDGYRQTTLVEAWKKAGGVIQTGAGVGDGQHLALQSSADIANTTSQLFESLREAADKLSIEHRLYVLVDETDSLLRYPPDEVAELMIALRSEIQQLDQRVCWLFASLRPLEWMVDSRKTIGETPNFAVRVTLDPFPNDKETWDQICALGFENERRETLNPVIEGVLQLTGGNAQLTSAVLYELQVRVGARTTVFQEIREELTGGGRCFVDNHIDGIAQQLLSDPGQTVFLLDAWERILKGERVRDAGGEKSFEFLASIGLLKVGGGFYAIANDIYNAHLHDGWISDIRQRHQVSRDRTVGRSRPVGGHSRVAVLSVGGTIGMITDGGESTFQGADERLVEVVEEALQPIAEASWISFGHFDGINVTPDDWSRIASWIHGNRERFDGFVLAHGTDTLASAASGVAFALGRSVNKPVVFTGSQATISIPHGDALDNLRRSCFVAAHEHAPREVQVQFGNQVFRAVRVEKADDRLFQGFRSTGWPELAQVSEELLVNRYALDGRGEEDEDRGFQPHFASNILAIFIVPGLPVRFFEAVISDVGSAAQGIDGLIIHTPGAGNIPYRENNNFRDLIKRAVDAEIPVVVTSQVPINPYTQPQYEMSRAVTDYGAILAGNMTFPAAHAKFAWVTGCVNHEAFLSGEARMREITRRMHHNYQGEQAKDPDGGTAESKARIGIHDK